MQKLKEKNYNRLLSTMRNERRGFFIYCCNMFSIVSMFQNFSCYLNRVQSRGGRVLSGYYPGNLFNLLKSGCSQVAMVTFLPNPSLIILGGRSSVNQGKYESKR